MKSIISWLGGKSRSVKKILPLIPEHRTYVEPFAGALWILFAKEKSSVEIVNDIDGDLMNFWEVVKNAPDQFIRSFDYCLISRKTFEEYRKKFMDKEYDDCIERAHIFYYILKSCFGARMSHPDFGIIKQGIPNLNFDRIEQDIQLAHERLKRVVIENRDYSRVIKSYDYDNSFMFMDPPYYETAQYSVGKFKDEDYIQLSEQCKSMKGKFLLSINSHDFIRNLFKDFNFVEHKVTYSVSKTNKENQKYGEILIKNY